MGLTETKKSSDRLEEMRLQPAIDLLNRIPDLSPRRIADLGCGEGETTALLAQRFAGAEIIGIEQSEVVLAGARARLSRIRFDIPGQGYWKRIGQFDLIFSNGAVRTMPLLRPLLPKLLSQVSPGGLLAIQTPINLHEPYRVLIRMVAADGPWAKRLLPIAKSRPFNESSEGLYASIGSLCALLDIWEITYIHIFDGISAAVEWMKATSLEPFLAPLGETARRNFLERYTRELATAYPAQDDGKMLLRFPRLFFLARR